MIISFNSQSYHNPYLSFDGKGVSISKIKHKNPNITARNKKIATLIRKGISVADIAKEMNLSKAAIYEVTAKYNLIKDLKETLWLIGILL